MPQRDEVVNFRCESVAVLPCERMVDLLLILSKVCTQSGTQSELWLCYPSTTKFQPACCEAPAISNTDQGCQSTEINSRCSTLAFTPLRIARHWERDNVFWGDAYRPEIISKPVITHLSHSAGVRNAGGRNAQNSKTRSTCTDTQASHA